MKGFVGKYFSSFRLTVLVGIIATMCLLYFGDKFYDQGKELFSHYDFKFFLILVLCVGWLFFYVVFLHRKVIEIINFFTKANFDLEKDMVNLNKNTRNLILEHLESEDNEVA